MSDTYLVCHANGSQTPRLHTAFVVHPLHLTFCSQCVSVHAEALFLGYAIEQGLPGPGGFLQISPAPQCVQHSQARAYLAPGAIATVGRQCIDFAKPAWADDCPDEPVLEDGEGNTKDHLPSPVKDKARIASQAYPVFGQLASLWARPEALECTGRQPGSGQCTNFGPGNASRAYAGRPSGVCKAWPARRRYDGL